MSTKDLIERLRTENRDSVFPELCAEAADALERLTQPVGVEPFTFYIDDIDDGEINREYNERNEFSCGRTGGLPLYSAETVARLIAERDEAHRNAHWQARRNSDLGQERDTLQEQVKLLRDALDDAVICIEWDGANAIKQREALAATEPKEKTE